jgi:NAD(P)-dependent dehydrogenase (short-subunit alcohol dehydrogenase family)
VAAGARVALLDRPASAGAEVAKEFGPTAVFTPGDVTSADDVTGALERASAACGGLNVLVNCAGIGTAMKTYGKAGPAKLEEFTRVIQVNLIGTFNCIRLAAVHMARNAPTADGERGVVINTASVAAFDGQIGQAAYSASKGGCGRHDPAHRPGPRPAPDQGGHHRARAVHDPDVPEPARRRHRLPGLHHGTRLASGGALP